MKVIVPRHSSDTRSPLLPSSLYLIGLLLSRTSHAESAFDSGLMRKPRKTCASYRYFAKRRWRIEMPNPVPLTDPSRLFRPIDNSDKPITQRRVKAAIAKQADRAGKFRLLSKRAKI